MNMSKRGLGKGLDALLATSAAAEAKQSNSHSSSETRDGQLHQLAIGQLQSGRYQPRTAMSSAALSELADSIRSQGIIQPIVVRPLAGNKYEIIAGERRWQAAYQAGLQSVPCLVKEVDDRATVAMALIENIQREDLNAIEEARAFERLQLEFSLTHQQIADAVGKSRTAISNLLRLNQLSEPIKTFVEQKKLEMGHARALLALDDTQQLSVAQKITSKMLTVRETEKLVKSLLEPKPAKEVEKKTPAISELQNRLTARFDTNVAINQNKNGKGKIVISFDQPEKLEKIISLLELDN